MGQGNFSRKRVRPSSGQGFCRGCMMGIPKRSCPYHRSLLSQKPGHTVDPGQFHTFLFLKGRKDRWEPAGDHRLSCPLCSDKKNIMKAGRRDHRCSLGCLLPENICEILLVRFFVILIPFFFPRLFPFIFFQLRRFRDSPVFHLCMFHKFPQASHSQYPDPGKFLCF